MKTPIVFTGELKDSLEGYAEVETKFDNKDVAVEISAFDESSNVFPECLEKFKDKMVKLTIELL